jgi:F-type H+-transporting ATPase subunit delta
LATSKQRGAVATLSAFHRLVQLDHDRHSAIVESAAPLDTLVRNALEGDLRRMYGPAIVTSFTENPALLGGVRIKVASDVYDGSIRGRLAALQARL